MVDPRLAAFAEKLQRSGASQEILARSLRASRAVPIDDEEKEEEKGSYGGLLGGILRLASNLDRPAGAVRAGITGNNPLEGFKNPEDYSLVDPNDNPFMRFLGGAAESVLDPLNLVGAKYLSPLAKESSFLKKFAAEAVVNVGARGASELTADAIPDDANPWLQGLGPLAAGFAGGGGVQAGISRGVRRGARALDAPRDVARTLEDQIAEDYPSVVFADRTSPPATSLEVAIRTQEENTSIAALGINARKIREQAENAAISGTDEYPTLTISEGLLDAIDKTEARFRRPANQLHGETIDRDEFFYKDGLNNKLEAGEAGAGGAGGGGRGGSGYVGDIPDDIRGRDPGKSYDARQLGLAEDTFEASKQRIDNLRKRIPGFGMPGWMAQSVNGRINRSPLAHEAAETAHAYFNAQQAQTADIHARATPNQERLFGKFVDKVTVKGDAPQHVRHAFTNAQAFALQNKDGSGNWAAMGEIIYNPDYFNVSPEQRTFLEQMQELLKADNNLSRDFFGVDVKELDGFYDPRAAEVVHLDNKSLATEEQIRLLGGRQNFQHHRDFENPYEIMLAASNPEYYKDMLRSAMAKTDDPDELARLQDMINSDIKINLKPMTFADALADRLSQSAKVRSEKLALKILRENGASIKEIQEMESLIGAGRVSEAIGLPAQAAGFLRQMTLSADFSVLGSHWLGHMVMGRGMKGLMQDNQGGFLRAVTSDEGWARFQSANVDEMMDAANHNLELNTEDFLLPDNAWLHKALTVGAKNFVDPVTGKPTPLKVGGTDVNVLGKAVRTLDKIQYGRMVKAWKLDTYRNTFELMQAYRDGHVGLGTILKHPGLLLGEMAGSFNKSDDELKRAAAAFSNNLFGGLNRVADGRTATHNLLESLFVLTPGFTRGTLNIGFQAINPLRWDAQAALSRDFAMRGLILAGSVMTGIAMAAGLEAPNVTDPTKSDWMVLKLPGGKDIKPLARWRSSGQIVGKTVDAWMNGGPIEAAQYFGPAALKWGTYRQSGIISAGLGDPVGDIGRAQFGQPDAGNSFVAGLGIKDLLLNPEQNFGRQIGEAGLRAGAPATAQNVLQTYREDGSLTAAGLKNVGFTIATEFFGVSSTGRTQMELAIVAKGSDWAASNGVSPEMIDLAVSMNQNPITFKDPATGQYILDSKTRQKGVEALAAELGITTEQVYRKGRLSEREKKADLEKIKTQQIDSFFTGMDLADANYAKKMAQAQEALDKGLVEAPEISKFISEARKARSAEKGMVEQLNPAALAFLQSPDQLAKKNSKDRLFSAIAAEYYSKDFYDANTLSFDFDAQAAWITELRNKYGSRFDEWQVRNEEKKTPLERARDQAFDRLDQYFQVADEVWQRTTGGVLGKNEGQFDQSLSAMLKEQGITDDGQRQYIMSEIKSNIEPIKNAKNYTSQLRDIMRAADPQLEDDVVTWLGNMPIEYKSMSKARRATINAILLKNTE